jgi:hypothetical protein
MLNAAIEVARDVSESLSGIGVDRPADSRA